MEFMSFSVDGANCFGSIDGDNVVDWSNIESYAIDLKSVLGHGIDSLKHLCTRAKNRGKSYRVEECSFLPVIPNPGKIICVGLNYEMHRVETKRQKAGYPTIFARYTDSQTGHKNSLMKPKLSDRFDFEGELAIVIGKPGRYIDESSAMDWVAGYSIYNDASVRDFQRHTHQFTPGKNFPSTGAFGPFLVTADSIFNYEDLNLETRLNGEIMQRASLSDLIFSIPKLIAYCSQFSNLYPGDVIVTGTPGGVGDRRDPPVYMQAGDKIEVEIAGVGILKNDVVNEV